MTLEKNVMAHLYETMHVSKVLLLTLAPPNTALKESSYAIAHVLNLQNNHKVRDNVTLDTPDDVT